MGVRGFLIQNVPGLINNGADITVATFANLPPAADNTDKMAIVLADSGVAFINKKYAGTYVSDGADWLPIEETDGTSASIDFDNTISDLVATTVKTALDELQDEKIEADSADSLTNKTLNSATNNIHADVVHLFVRNVSGSALSKGSPVYLSGYSAGQERVEIQAADADGAATFPAIGLVEDVSLEHNSNGQVLVTGVLSDFDTTGTDEGESWEVGQSLFLSTTSGELTNVRPNTEAKVQSVCKVLRVHASQGQVLIQGAGRVNDIPNQLTMFNNTAIRTGETNGDTYHLQAYDVDGAAYVTFATLTAGNTPTMDFNAAVTVNGEAIVTSVYAEIHLHDNTTATPIDTVDIPHLVQGLFSEHLPANGFTFEAGGTGAITAFADAGGGKVTVSSAAHGRSNGAVISQSGTTNYNGIYIISGVTAGSYDITATWLGDDASGNWYHGDNLKLDAGFAGLYDIDFNGYGSSALANKVFEFRIYKNIDFISNLHAKRKFATVDIGPFAGSGLIQLADGDIISFGVVGETDTTNFTLEHSDINITKH